MLTLANASTVDMILLVRHSITHSCKSRIMFIKLFSWLTRKHNKRRLLYISFSKETYNNLINVDYMPYQILVLRCLIQAITVKCVPLDSSVTQRRPPSTTANDVRVRSHPPTTALPIRATLTNGDNSPSVTVIRAILVRLVTGWAHFGPKTYFKVTRKFC